MRPIELTNVKLGRRPNYRPTVVGYNRLEGRPRTAQFDRALRAEVRDALWLLSKQWQVGEFQGDDAASPVVAKLLLHTSRMDRYQGGESGAVVPLPEDRPLEMEVERQSARMRQAGRPVGLDLRLAVGRYWKKLLRQAGLDRLISAYRTRYTLRAPDPDQEADIPLTAHPRVWQRFRAAAGRSLDGYALIEHLRADSSHRAADGLSGLSPDEETQLDDLAEQLVRWWEALLQQQDDRPNDSWRPDALEHRFAVGAPDPAGGDRQVYRAEEYYHGHLDWYNLDAEPGSNASIGAPDAADAAQEKVVSFFPSALRFGGMPDPRWWTLEERQTSFVALRPDTTDVNKLLLMDFQLQYANDWFLLPLELPAGSVARVGGLLVTDSFGERTWVEAAGAGRDQDWERWSLFHPSVAGTADVPASRDLLVLPSVPKVLEGRPQEEVRLVRDEMANMVWALEAGIQMDDGQPRRGKEAARALRARYAAAFEAPSAPTPSAPARYRIVNSVPEHWIPLIPVHVPGQQRQIQLQRAAIPRILPGDPDPPRKIEPRTGLLRTGLDEAPPQPYFLHEEEVPRAGTHVRLAYQRTRWYDGRVYTWLGIRKTTGRGEGSSGLAFDQLEIHKAKT